MKLNYLLFDSGGRKKGQGPGQKLGLPYLDLTTIPIEIESLVEIDEAAARQAKMVVIQKIDKNLKIAVENSSDPATKKVLADLLNADSTILYLLFRITVYLELLTATKTYLKKAKKLLARFILPKTY